MKASLSVNIGLCGFGTVGQGVYKHLVKSRADITERLGAEVKITRIAVNDINKKRSVKVSKQLLTEDALEIANDPSIHVVCELIGGTALARKVTLAALKHGKIVVSANKALICDHGAEIFEAARKFGGHFFFEASVAGGIPIIKALREGLVANRFSRIYGILNGTCNYILTQMGSRGLPYSDVLKQAKELGYAEADESLDVEGWDTAHKASVLAWLAHGVWVKPSQMIVEGINRLSPADLSNAATLGYSIKLLAVITRDFSTNELCVRVHPTLLPVNSVVASVGGVFNAVAVTGDVVGTTHYIGRGAGQDATASAVISDIADAVALIKHGKGTHLTSESYEPNTKGCMLAPLERITGSYYIRLTVKDQSGVLAKVARVLSQNKVSIATMIQNPAHVGAASLVLTTHETNEKSIGKALKRLSALGSVLETPLVLRIGNFTD